VLEVTVTAAVSCINPTAGGTIAAAQSGTSPFNPAAFTSSSSATGETGTLEYKWQSSTTSNSAGFSDIASSNSATYDAGALTVTTWYKRLARVSCSADWTGAAASNVLAVIALVVLPIDEISLSALVQQNGIKLKWTNPYDKDLSKYEVERSADGRIFTKVNTQAAGNGIQKNITYNWFDATPIEGYNYYRIKGLALNNGKTQWSNNLKIRSWTVNIGTTIVPNPAERTGLNIKTDLPKGYYDMKLIDNRGRVVYTKGVEYNGLGGAIELRYGVALAAGTYYLHIEGMGERVVRGVVVR
jgi:hypothetical protein